MYMACMYVERGLRLIEGRTQNHTMNLGNIVAIKQWAIKFPPSDRELRRNNLAESLQGNRNPFIDDPQLCLAVQW